MHTNVTIRSIAGCPIYSGLDPYWMLSGRWVGFILDLCLGLIIAFAGRFLWKFVHFSAGSFFCLTFCWTILDHIYKNNGYSLGVLLWILYPTTLIFSIFFGLFLVKFPRIGCIWVAWWTGYFTGANLIYNLIFNWIEYTDMRFFWFISLSTALLFSVLTGKITRKDD